MTPDLLFALDIAILVAAGALTLLLALLLSLLLQPAARRPGRWGNRFFGLVCAAPPTSQDKAPLGHRLRRLASPRTPRAARRLKEMLSKPGTKGYHGVAARDVAAASGA